MKEYSVKKLAKMAGVSIRTLHLYDQIGLLKPAIRTEARYRLYGEKELLRLQQILFYKELDFSLQDILSLLDKPDFNIFEALENHKKALFSKRARINTMLETIDKTITNLTKGTMLKHEELYEGLTQEQAEVYRKEASDKWGEEVVEKSEKSLRNMTKSELDTLRTHFMEVGKKLTELTSEAPTFPEVQTLIAQHYQCICQFLGSNPSAEAYIGLGELYVTDERYTMNDGKQNPHYALFMSAAMAYYAEINL